MKRSNIEIDTLRGLACLLVVGYHATDVHAPNLISGDGSFIEEFNQALFMVRMPLFTFLSGLVYSMRPVQTFSSPFLIGKVRRLLVPMLTVGTTLYVMQYLTPGTVAHGEPFPLLHVEPMFPFWFLEALFQIYVIVAILEHTNQLVTLRSALAVFVGACLLCVSGLGTEYFAFQDALYLLPFFLAGMIVRRYEILEKISDHLGIVVAVSCLAFLTFAQSIDGLDEVPRRSFLALFVGTMCCISLIAVKPRVEVLAKLGAYSFSIYLFHIFFIGAGELLLMFAGLYEQTILLAVCLTLGVLGPIAVDHLLNGTNWTRMAFLGKSRTSTENLWLSRQLVAKPWAATPLALRSY